MCLSWSVIPAFSYICCCSSTEGIGTDHSAGMGDGGDLLGESPEALCINLIESLIFFSLIIFSLCTTWMSLCVLQIPWKYLSHFLIGERDLCGGDWYRRSDRLSQAV